MGWVGRREVRECGCGRLSATDRKGLLIFFIGSATARGADGFRVISREHREQPKLRRMGEVENWRQNERRRRGAGNAPAGRREGVGRRAGVTREWILKRERKRS